MGVVLSKSWQRLSRMHCLLLPQQFVYPDSLYMIRQHTGRPSASLSFYC